MSGRKRLLSYQATLTGPWVEAMIREYIRYQEKEDLRVDQLNMWS
ncbi:hypothetical protein NR402_18000 [Acidithiobacillus ferrooxidans]|nr:hypothetical protein [Acidithiobacillus ferrooxidans]MCR2832138.1 hypothetical protein [Acidithiobacillus ferrooxidans]